MNDRLLFDAAPVATLVCDAESLAVLAANERAADLYRDAPDELARGTLLDLVAAGEGGAVEDAFATMRADESRVLRVGRRPAGDGSSIDVDLAISATIAWQDGRARVVAVLGAGASHGLLDALRTDESTGLPNYVALFETAAHDAERGAALALVRMTWVGAASQRGHRHRDDSARASAAVLARHVPAGAQLARYAEDVFAVCVPGGRMRSMLAFARHVATAFEQPISLGDDEIVAYPRIGIAVSAGSPEIAALARDAQAALDYAQLDGEQVGVFSEELTARHDRRAIIDRNLRHAIAQRRLTAVYQPVVRLGTEEIVGAEALMRWDCPGIGFVPPDEFIGIAAESSLIVRLDEWMLREACAQVRRWQLAGFAGLRVAVNVSARAADQREFVKLVATICEAVGLDPGDLQLDLGEDTLAPDRIARRNLEALRRLGVRVAIDDFGSGASALSELGDLPLDAIKIDRPFVGPIAADAFRAEVVRSVVTLAHRRGLQVIAEGVETSAQAEVLREVGCDDAQGYLFGAPASASELTARLERGQPESVRVSSRRPIRPKPKLTEK